MPGVEDLVAAEVEDALGAVPVAGEADGLALREGQGARGVDMGGDDDRG